MSIFRAATLLLILREHGVAKRDLPSCLRRLYRAIVRGRYRGWSKGSKAIVRFERYVRRSSPVPGPAIAGRLMGRPARAPDAGDT